MGFLYKILYEVEEFVTLTVRSVTNVFRRPRYIQDTFQQMETIGVRSILIVVLVGFFTGGVLALQTSKSLKAFGAVNLMGQLISLSLIREMGPVLTALMLAGRAGSGIASELGSMVVTEQISAMRALGTDPVKKLVTPRVLACTTMVPLLTVIADVFGLIGGWIVSFYNLRLNTALYWNTAFRAIDYNIVLEGLMKPVVFGFIIGSVGCYYGLGTRGGTRGVGRNTTQAVVTASILVIVADFFLGKLILELWH